MILFVRDLTVIDFSYLCAKRGMLGESYIVDVELHGGLDQTSMVLDFAKVKKVIKQAIDQLVDHKLAVPALSAALTMDSSAELQRLSFQSARGRISMAAPAQAIVAIGAEEVNEHSVTAFLQQQIAPLLPDNVLQLIFTLRPEASNSFYFIASPENAGQRYLFKGSLDGSSPVVRVTPEQYSGQNKYYIAKDGSRAMHSYSSFNQPPVSQIIQVEGHKTVKALTRNAELKAKLAKENLPRHEFFQVPARDGVVLDEGHTHRGPAQIADWKSATQAKYAFIATPHTVAQDGRAYIVTCTVSGAFPGSPVDLRYTFTLARGRIASLEIAP